MKIKRELITPEYLLSIGFYPDLPYTEHIYRKSGGIELCDYEGLQEFEDGSKRADIQEDEYIFTKDDGYVPISRCIKYIDELNEILPYMR